MPSEPKADLVLRGGRVFLGSAGGFDEAMAIGRGRIRAIGRDADVEPLAGPGTRVIELRGRLATPALDEARLPLLPIGPR